LQNQIVGFDITYKYIYQSIYTVSTKSEPPSPKDLPSEVVSAPSLNTFKGRLDKYWGHHCYSLDPSMFVQRQPVNSQQVILA